MPIDKLTLGAAMALCGGGGGGSTVDYEARNMANDALNKAYNALDEADYAKSLANEARAGVVTAESNISNLTNDLNYTQTNLSTLSTKIQKIQENGALSKKQTSAIVNSIYEFSKYNKALLADNIALGCDKYFISHYPEETYLEINTDGYNGITLNGVLKPNKPVKISLPIEVNNNWQYSLVARTKKYFNKDSNIKICFGSINDETNDETVEYTCISKQLMDGGNGGSVKGEAKWSSNSNNAFVFIISTASEDVILQQEQVRFFVLPYGFYHYDTFVSTEFDKKIDWIKSSLPSTKFDLSWSAFNENVTESYDTQIITTQALVANEVNYISVEGQYYEFVILGRGGYSTSGQEFNLGIYDRVHRCWQPIDNIATVPFYTALTMDDVEVTYLESFKIIARSKSGDNIDIDTFSKIAVWKTTRKIVEDLTDKNDYLHKCISECSVPIEGNKCVIRLNLDDGNILSAGDKYCIAKIYKIEKGRYKIYQTGIVNTTIQYGLYNNFRINEAPIQETYSTSAESSTIVNNSIGTVYLIVQYVRGNNNNFNNNVYVVKENNSATPLNYITDKIYDNDIADEDIFVNDLIVWHGGLYKCTADVHSGETISQSNVESTTLVDYFQRS